MTVVISTQTADTLLRNLAILAAFGMGLTALTKANSKP